MKETKKVQVKPSAEEYTINDMACFGWQLVSSQEVKTKDSHLENRGGSIYSVTESENYVNLIFSRETTIPNYNEITKLEKTYNDAIDTINRLNSFKITTCIFMLALLIVPGVLYIKKCFVDNPKIRKENQHIAYEAKNKAVKLLDSEAA